MSTVENSSIYLVDIDDDTLRSLGMTLNQLGQLKANKLSREKQALAIIQQSGVPSDRWPKFRDTVYYLDKDFTGDLQRFAEAAFSEGRPLTGTGYYTELNSDGTRTEYPFTVGEFVPTTNTSPVQKVVEILTDANGNIQVTNSNKQDLLDIANYLTSAVNYKKHAINITSLRAPYANSKFYTVDELNNNPTLQEYFNQLTTKQADSIRSYIKSLNTQLIDNNFFLSLDGASNSRNRNTAGQVLSKSGNENSTFVKYNNVILVSLTTSAVESDRNLVVDYEYGAGKSKKETVEDKKKQTYEKFYKDTKATTVMPVSGVNVQVVFEFPANDAHKSVYLYMPDMITISHSVHRTKIPVSVLGDTTVTGIGLGTKMVAGSIVKVFTRRDTFHNYIKLFVDERSNTMSKAKKASLVSVQNTLSFNEMSDHMRDDIGPFNIHLISMSEYDCVYKDPPKVDSILGCTILNSGKVYSIENLITEETLSFMAKTVVYSDDMDAKVSNTVGSETLQTGSSLLATLRGG